MRLGALILAAAALLLLLGIAKDRVEPTAAVVVLLIVGLVLYLLGLLPIGAP